MTDDGSNGITDTSPAIKSASGITPENVHEVEPKSKFDLDRVELLKAVDPVIWAPIVPDLIDWTCDQNWPSTRVILPLLRLDPITIAAAIPYVSTILRKTGPPRTGFGTERDEEHQMLLLTQFVAKIDVSLQREMIAVLREFRDGVTEELEADWGLRGSVDEILKNVKRHDAEQKRASAATDI